MFGKAGTQRGRDPQIHLEPLGAQLKREASQRSKHQMSPLPMPSLRRELGATLDHEYPYLAG